MSLRRKAAAKRDATVPMINVAFLLLVFFMMVAVIAPPDPLDVLLPEAAFDSLEPPSEVLLIDGDGTLARGSLRDEAVFEGLDGKTLSIRADGRLDAAFVARVVARLTAEGVVSIDLVTVPRLE